MGSRINQHQKRIIAGVVVAFAIVSALYVPIQKSPVVHTAYASLLLGALIAGASLWQLSDASRHDYITALAFPLALKTYLTMTVAMAVAFVTLDLAGIWSISFPWYAALQIILLGFTGWKLLAIGSAADAIRQLDEHLQPNVTNWRLLQADAEAILRTAPSGIQRELSDMREAIKYADPMSRMEVLAQDREIEKCLGELRELLRIGRVEEAKSLCGRIADVVRDRANRLKILK